MQLLLLALAKAGVAYLHQANAFPHPSALRLARTLPPARLPQCGFNQYLI